jgi:hypothetical protein
LASIASDTSIWLARHGRRDELKVKTNPPRDKEKPVSNQQATPPAGSVIGQATGFEPASPGEPGAASIESALARNRAFAAAGGHQDAVIFPNLRLFVITCLDPRVDPAHFLGLELSDAIVVRNVGGRVTREVINDVASKR